MRKFTFSKDPAFLKNIGFQEQDFVVRIIKRKSVFC